MTDNNQLTTDAAHALSEMPKDLAMIKMENDSIMSLAASRPRDMKAIKEEMLSQLDAFPVFAQAAVYSKPVGTDQDTGRKKTVRGLSIRAAEALAECYGFCRVRAFVEPIGDDAARVTASFTDFQRGRVWEDSGIVSKFYKTRNGAMARTPEDRFWGVVCKAEASRRIREVILRSVPPGLKMELQALAEKAMAAVLSDTEVQKIIAAFRQHHVTLEMIEGYLDKTISAGWNADDRVELQALYNAIRDGETTVAEAFGDQAKTARAAVEQKPAKQPATNGGASVSDLTSPREKADANPATKRTKQDSEPEPEPETAQTGTADDSASEPSTASGTLPGMAADAAEPTDEQLGVEDQFRSRLDTVKPQGIRLFRNNLDSALQQGAIHPDGYARIMDQFNEQFFQSGEST